jgi:hypothetical protein
MACPFQAQCQSAEMAKTSPSKLTIESFAAHSRRIESAVRRGAEIVDQVKRLLPEPKLRLSCIEVVAEGAGWLIIGLFGREVLFRAEIQWQTVEPQTEVVAYLNVAEFGDEEGGRTWQPLKVSVQSGRVPADEDGETVSESWYMLESVLASMFARGIVFRPAIPDRPQAQDR